MKKLLFIAAVWMLSACGGSANKNTTATTEAASTATTMYYNGDIITMEGDQPQYAEAVVVKDGKIVYVGTKDEAMKAAGEGHAMVDLQGKTMLPGFIDPHVHPSIATGVLTTEIVSAMEWTTPSGKSVVVKDRTAFLERLKELDKSYTDPEKVLIAWGYFKPYHGVITRPDLNKISATRPIVVWQRSIHEFFFNDAALKFFNLTEAAFKKSPDYSNWKDGHVWEAGLFSVAQSVVDYMGSPENFKKGLALMTTVMHKGGLTTIAEQGYPQVDLALEDKLVGDEVNKATTPYRFTRVPNAMYLYPRLKSGKAILNYCDSLIKTGTPKMGYVKAIKLYVDGAIFSQLMMMSKDYEDHHHGAWMMQPKEQDDVFSTFYKANWDIHIHVNGDAGLDTLLAIHDRAKAANPTSTSKIFIEHYGYARPDQHERVAKNGILVSNNPYYYYELSDPYSKEGLGKERASKISSIGSLEKLHVPLSFHSDYIMAPAEPLVLVWCAVNRVNSVGNVLAPEEKVSLWTGMKAITIESARSIKMEDEIGSIKAGKKADFVLLAENPFKIDPIKIKDIKILSTILEGIETPVN